MHRVIEKIKHDHNVTTSEEHRGRNLQESPFVEMEKFMNEAEKDMDLLIKDPKIQQQIKQLEKEMTPEVKPVSAEQEMPVVIIEEKEPFHKQHKWWRGQHDEESYKSEGENKHQD